MKASKWWKNGLISINTGCRFTQHTKPMCVCFSVCICVFISCFIFKYVCVWTVCCSLIPSDTSKGNSCLKHGAQWLFSVQVLGWTRAINVWSMELCDCFLLRYRDRPGQYYFLLRYWDGPGQYMFEVWSSGIVFCSSIGREIGKAYLKYRDKI